MGGSSDDIYLCKQLKDAKSLHDSNSKKNRYVQDIKVKSSPDQTTAKSIGSKLFISCRFRSSIKVLGSNSTYVYMSQNYPVGETNLKHMIIVKYQIILIQQVYVVQQITQ